MSALTSSATARPGGPRATPRRGARAAAACLLAVALGTAHATAATPARSLYERAVAQDRGVRAAMAEADPARRPALKEFREAIAAYRRVVLAHPTSGYSDNALWQGALLAVEAFDRFGQERDRQTALSFLRWLVREYPTSPFVGRARASASRVEGLTAPPAKAAPTPAPTATPGAAQASPAPPLPATPREAAQSPSPVTIGYVQRSLLPEATEVVIYLDGPVSFKVERLSGPDRIFFDLAGTRPAEALKDAVLTFDTGLVRQIRVGRHPGTVTRIVLDAEGVDQYRTYLRSGPDRLVVTCWPPGVAPPDATPSRPDGPALPSPVVALAPPPTGTVDASPAAPTVGAPASEATARPPVAPSPDTTSAPPAPTPVVIRPGAAAPSADASRAQPRPVDAATPEPPSANVRGGYSLARQLGLGASRIVIDAGHGGHDPGATVGTTTEAAITLDIALRLERLLLKHPGIEVVLTRRTDEFLPLQERTEIANREQADLFISIHVNASRNPSARGVETYLLDFASTAEAEAVAARENASSMLTMAHLNDLVKKIALTTKADESRDLAVHLQRTMVRRLGPHNSALRDLGVKSAPFVVLIGASMPSVLVEVAFLTHRQEHRLLAGAAYRQRVAESLDEGIRRYLLSLKRSSPVVRQSSPLPAGARGRPGESIQ